MTPFEGAQPKDHEAGPTQRERQKSSEIMEILLHLQPTGGKDRCDHGIIISHNTYLDVAHGVANNGDTNGPTLYIQAQFKEIYGRGVPN